MTTGDGPGPQSADSDLARSTKAFFQLSTALVLSEAENRALLDLPADVIAALRAGTVDLPGIDPSKLQRRLDYAIPILQRMLASLAS